MNRAAPRRASPVPDLLLHRVCEGDNQAVRECISRYGGLVWTLARRAGIPESDIEEAVQEIFAEIWRSGSRYDPTIASETAFIATIARRRLIDRRRRAGRRPATQAIGDEPSIEARPAPLPELGEEAATAARALESLSPEQQRVLRLSVYEGLSHELISRTTGLPLGTVKTHARRGLMRLREMLGVEPPPGGASA
ncbi:MAG: sigma-70 family RNA polymerase sigma factor [Planctomycetota bacterium]|nr:sigma-70 family RNA polymerase sigma factor [Planctomycetota bacterium]